MSNQTLFFLTALVIIGMAVLLGINLTTAMSGQPKEQTYMKYNEVRGVAVEHNKMLYTLNFTQQNQLIDILNRAVHIKEIKPGTRQKPDIDKIVIYQFDGKPDLVVTPLTYLDNNLIFTQHEWDKDGYLMEMSNGVLQKLIAESYDH